MNRRSYSGLMRQPAWLLLDEDGKVVASVRAENRGVARKLFKRAGLAGRLVRRAND